MTRFNKLALVPAILLLLPSTTLPQSQVQNKPEDMLRLGTDLVVLEVDVVSRKTGHAIDGLRAEDFEVFEDGVKQTITHFSQDRLPLSVLILLDVSGSVWPSIKELREGAFEALQNLKPADEISVMIFAGEAKLILPFTKDKEAAAVAVRNANSKEVGTDTNTNEAVFQAAAYMKHATNPNNRRIIVAVTDDISTYKVPMPHSQLETVHEVDESGSIVCGLIFDSVYKRRGEQAPDDPYTASLRYALINGATDVVKFYVERTGGAAIEANQRNVKDKFIHLLHKLRSRYSLGYVSTNPNQYGKFRRVRLRLTTDALNRFGDAGIITRQGKPTAG